MREVVSPHYLKVMGFNALRHGTDHRDAIVATGATVTPDEVCSLLRSGWREQAMGAWYSLVVHDENGVVPPAICSALEKSNGTLTAPPLVVAAVTLGWLDALPALRRYIERDLEGGWGSAAFAAAAIEYLGVDDAGIVPTDHDRMQLRELLAFGHTLRSA